MNQPMVFNKLKGINKSYKKFQDSELNMPKIIFFRA